MSLKLVKQFEKAIGQTQHVIAVVFDIRGFTNFCRGEDSFNIANFVRRVYIRVLSDYFQDVTYCKPTGDGLLMVFNCSSGKEIELTISIVERSVKLVKDFGSLCKDDARIYFKTPCNSGIGISRGSGCCIVSDGEILDYSGKPLNIASRLSDMARPLGVIFDESISSCLSTTALKKDFLRENVYIKGLAEEEPLTVYCIKGTIISNSYKRPLNEPDWITDSIEFTVPEFESLKGGNYAVYLTRTPLDTSQIIFKLTFFELGVQEENYSYYTWNMNEKPEIFYKKRGKEHIVLFKTDYIAKLLKDNNVRHDKPIKIDVTYPSKP